MDGSQPGFMNTIQAGDLDVLHPTCGMSHQQNREESEAAPTHRSRLTVCFGIDVDVLHPTSGLSHQQNSGASEEALTYRSRLSACYGIEEAILRIDGSIGLDTSHSSAEMYEPQRFFDTKFALPPKRFHRTFWRSAAMRLIQQQRLKLT